MANASPVSVGKINTAGTEDALFLKVFAGEVRRHTIQQVMRLQAQT
jgi:hypothetical protein